MFETISHLIFKSVFPQCNPRWVPKLTKITSLGVGFSLPGCWLMSRSSWWARARILGNGHTQGLLLFFNSVTMFLFLKFELRGDSNLWPCYSLIVRGHFRTSTFKRVTFSPSQKRSPAKAPGTFYLTKKRTKEKSTHTCMVAGPSRVAGQLRPSRCLGFFFLYANLLCVFRGPS